MLQRCIDVFVSRNREQTKALDLDQMEENKRRVEEDLVVPADIDKFNLSRAFPSVVYIESGTLYLQGCQIYVEYYQTKS